MPVNLYIIIHKVSVISRSITHRYLIEKVAFYKNLFCFNLYTKFYVVVDNEYGIIIVKLNIAIENNKFRYFSDNLHSNVHTRALKSLIINLRSELQNFLIQNAF